MSKIDIRAKVVFDSSEIDLQEVEEEIAYKGQVTFSDHEVEIDLGDIETDDLINELLSRTDVTRQQADDLVQEMFDVWPSLEREFLEEADTDYYDDDEPENLLDAMKLEVAMELANTRTLQELEGYLARKPLSPPNIYDPYGMLVGFK